MRLGEDVTVVTQNTRQEFIDLAAAAGAKILTGDARADHVLLQAGLETAKTIIACVDDDVTNIEIALDARRLNPSVRVITRLFDQTLARRLESTVGIDRALGMSVLAAPMFAAAALGEFLFGSFMWKGTPYVSVRCPQDDLPTGSVTYVSEPLEGEVEVLMPFSEYGIDLELFESKRISPFSKLATIPGTVRRFWEQAPRLLKAVSLVILALTLVSVFVFQVGLKLSMVDALYFVIATVTTTGYGDITPKEGSPLLKAYACVLMLLGSAGIATLYSLITDFIVSARFDELLGRRIAGMRGHVVVVGLGNVGFRTTENLIGMGSKVAVVDLDSDAPYRQLLDKKIVFTAGDGRDAEALERAGARFAKAVIAATQNDAVNLSTGLAARSLNPHARVIVRIFDAGFARKVEEVRVVDMAMSASRIAAPGFVGATLFPEALLCYVHGDRFCIVREGPESQLTIESIPLRPGIS